MRKIWGFIKNHKIITTIVAIIAAFIIFQIVRPDKPVERETVTTQLKTVAQELEVTGRVEAAADIQLSVQSGGKVAGISHKVGSKVRAGDIILSVADKDLQLRLSRQQAALKKAQLALQKLSQPLAEQNDVEAAQEAVADAQSDLATTYEEGFNSVTNAFLDIPSAQADLKDVLTNRSYLTQNFVRSIYGDTTDEYRERANDLYFDAKNAFDDLEKAYRVLTRDSAQSDIEALINQSYETAKITSDAIKSANNLLDYIESKADSEPATLQADQEIINGITADINTHNVALLEAKNAIKTAKDTITDSERTLAERQRALSELQSGGTDLETAQLSVEEAELDVQEVQNDIDERSVVSPIDGTVTRIDPDVGETVNAGSPIASVISNNDFQISVNLPEADLNKAAVGAEVTITLDAINPDRIFKGKVSSIDPAETVIEGVSTYRLVVEFLEMDPGIRSGMTADLTIKGQRKDNVIAVPQRAVFTRDNVKYVNVLENNKPVERQVTTGLRGSDGDVEITSGLSENELVVVFTSK